MQARHWVVVVLIWGGTGGAQGRDKEYIIVRQHKAVDDNQGIELRF